MSSQALATTNSDMQEFDLLRKQAVASLELLPWPIKRVGDPWMQRAMIEARFVSKVKPVGECIEWQGALFDNGYGAFTVQLGCQKRAHRFMWEIWYGPWSRSKRGEERIAPVSRTEIARRSAPPTNQSRGFPFR